MLVKKISSRIIKDSRKKKTILISIKTLLGNFITSAPAGKSTGEYEVKSYFENIEGDNRFINEFDEDKINKIINKYYKIDKEKAFEILSEIEKLFENHIGGNTLFCLEACFLKAFSKENNKELFEFLEGKKFPRPVGNAIGGGLHSRGIKGIKPDFQEFLFISNARSFKECVKINEEAYNLAKNYLRYIFGKKNDEGAFETKLRNEQVLVIMKKIKNELIKKYKNIDIGIDIAASSFFKEWKYIYKNPAQILPRNQQIEYVIELIEKYGLFYVEDPLEDNDFFGFKEIKNKTFRNLIVGDDLTTTNPKRLKEAISKDSINAIIVKPNQIGSLVKVKEVIEIAKQNNIKTIISHRSGETMDNTISDLAVGFECDFIKCGIHGKERKAKLDRIIEIEEKMKK